MARIWPFIYFTQTPGDTGPRRRLRPGEACVRFRFNGRRYPGVAGDTLAAALMANGCSLLGWSARYHRPRGAAALVRLDRSGRPPVIASARDVELYDGLVAQSTFWPLSVPAGLRTLSARAALLLPVKFRPRKGRRKSALAPDITEQLYLYADLVVVGSGPSGLLRALAAAREGREVIIIEQDFAPGGSLLYDDAPLEGNSADEWRQAALDELGAFAQVQILTRTKALTREGETRLHCRAQLPPTSGRADPFRPEQRDIHITAPEIVFETGEKINSFVFKNNDLPGIFHIRDALSLMNRHGIVPGQRMVLYCNHDAAYKFAAAALDDKLPLAAIIDVRDDVPDHCHQFARHAGIPLYPNHELLAAKGPFTLGRVILRKRGEDPLNRKILLDCDALIQSADIAAEVPMPETTGFGKCFADPEREQLYSRDLPAHVTRAVSPPPEAVRPERLSPLRQSPLGGLMEKAGARMRTRTGWRLADHVAQDGEIPAAAARREALAVREKTGLGDLADLGKIILQGPDAGRFLSALTGAPDWDGLPVGTLRRGLVSTAEDFVSAEVTGWRLTTDRYLLTFDASFSQSLSEAIKYHLKAGDYPRLFSRDVSDDRAMMLLAGPGAEALLARALPISVMDSALPPMAFRTLSQDGVPFVLARLDLTGGPAYGILTGAGHADLIFNLLLEKGRGAGLTLIGAAARDILRIEAGGLSAAEMEGGVRRADLTAETEHRGRGQQATDARQLVGLRAVSAAADGKRQGSLKAGMTLYEGDGQDPMGAGIGNITSASRSPLFEGDIALALLADGRARIGSLIRAVDPATGLVVDVKVGPPRFYPPVKEGRHA